MAIPLRGMAALNSRQPHPTKTGRYTFNGKFANE
jgi:hypothetical protein